MIYFVLGLGISVSINKKIKKKMIFFFGNCELLSISYCCKKKNGDFFFK